MIPLEYIANAVLKEDIGKLSQSRILDDLKANSTILVTGATGLICSQIVWALACHGVVKQKKLNILALVRNEEKAHAMFGKLIDDGLVTLCIGDIIEPVEVKQHVDYII